MQLSVQGAWGVIWIRLSQLSPPLTFVLDAMVIVVTQEYRQSRQTAPSGEPTTDCGAARKRFFVADHRPTLAIEWEQNP
jgi:hypothetical protein